MAKRRVYALYNRRCGHTIATAATRDYFLIPVAVIRDHGHPIHDLRTRVATDGDLLNLIIGQRCDRCTYDGATTGPAMADPAVTPKMRRRVQDDDGVVFTEHPSGRWVMENDPDSYRRLIDTWESYEQLLADAVELTELEPAPAYTDADLDGGEVTRG